MLPAEESVVVAGGGPAGFMAAITAAEGGVAAPMLLESTPHPLHKVIISGGGRCNVTHACWDPRVLVDQYPRGGPALRGPFERFACSDAVHWFKDHGLDLVEEPDGRLFPRSQRSSSVVATLRQAAAAAGVKVLTGASLHRVEPLVQGGFRLTLRDGTELRTRRLVLATGSHPSGHRQVVSLGHDLVPPVPSLFTLRLADQALTSLAGLAMDGVGLELLPPPGAVQPPGKAGRRAQRLRQKGTVLITHWGLSGPATLRLTAFAARLLRSWGYRAELLVDWSGDRSAADLESLFNETRRSHARRLLSSWRPWADLSRRLWLYLLERAAVNPTLRWADLDRHNQQNLISCLMASRHSVVGRGPFGEEFVTAGGIPLAEMNLATMESRIQPGLYIVGELLDVDGVTGGFNFQHCWSSGWIAGRALAVAVATASAEM